MYFYSWIGDDNGYCFVTGVITTKSYVKSQSWMVGPSSHIFLKQTFGFCMIWKLIFLSLNHDMLSDRPYIDVVITKD